MSVPKCYCMEPLRPDGTCRYGCPPEANPKLLRAQELARRERERAAERALARGLTTDEVRHAAAKLATPAEARRVAFWTRNDFAARARRGRR
jgi:hypothetical protein